MELNKPSVGVFHRRMGHLELGFMKEMAAWGKIEGFEPQEEELHGLLETGCRLCREICITPYSITHGEHGIAEVLHSFVTGPVQAAGYKGERYVVFLMDDATSYCDVRAAKTLVDATGSFNSALAQLQRWGKVKEVRITQILNPIDVDVQGKPKGSSGGEFEQLFVDYSMVTHFQSQGITLVQLKQGE